ncbi:MAG: hypothetical protein RR710_09045 [Oscillospiraceae bacterium]
MSKATSIVSTSLLMRIGPTHKIQQCFDAKTITFGCAANWLNYALKENNQLTGDFFECIFARLEKGDPRIDTMTDAKGNPMGDHLLVLENEADDSCILRLIPTILKPVMCFYSFNTNAIRKRFADGNSLAPSFGLNLDRYRTNMGYMEDSSSFLFITDPVRFFADLKKEIPLAVSNNTAKLTSKRFYGNFNPEEPMFFKEVDYDKHTSSEFYYDLPEAQEEMFWKMPEYRTQAELRITIPNINFVNLYDPNKEYNYEMNELNIFLPKFQEYATVVSAKEVHSLYFSEFDEKLNTYRWTILKSTEDELKIQLNAEGHLPF